MTQCIVQYQTRALVQMTFKGQCSLLRIILVMIYVCYCQQISLKDQNQQMMILISIVCVANA